jgi:hypothetical protein
VFVPDFPVEEIIESTSFPFFEKRVALIVLQINKTLLSGIVTPSQEVFLDFPAVVFQVIVFIHRRRKKLFVGPTATSTSLSGLAVPLAKDPTRNAKRIFPSSAKKKRSLFSASRSLLSDGGIFHIKGEEARTFVCKIKNLDSLRKSHILIYNIHSKVHNIHRVDKHVSGRCFVCHVG